jgi:hypothetical protein
MSRDGGESQLKSLQNVDQNLLRRLKGVGIESISDLATTTASELLEDYYSNYDEATRGIDFETISQLVLTAKQRLIDDGLLQKEFSSAEKMLEKREKLVRFPTGSQSFDLFLGGGTLCFGIILSFETKNWSIPSVTRSTFLSNSASVFP